MGKILGARLYPLRISRGSENLKCRAVGVTVERQRREDRGARNAEKVECGKGVSLPMGRRLGRGCVPSPEIVLTSEWKMARFGAFWVLFLQTVFI